MDSLAENRGPPAKEVEAKRPSAVVTLDVDWHDWLINIRAPGVAIAFNYVVRPPRALATGFEYRCSTAGVTSFVPYARLRWPTALATSLTDGTVVWTPQAISTSSLRSSISSNSWTADSGVTLSSQSNADSIYTTFASSGIDGQFYEIKNTITLGNGETNEALIILPVRA